MNELLREKTNQYCAKYHTPKAIISRELGVSLSHFCAYLKGERNLSPKRLELLKNYLEA